MDKINQGLNQGLVLIPWKRPNLRDAVIGNFKRCEGLRVPARLLPVIAQRKLRETLMP